MERAMSKKSNYKIPHILKTVLEEEELPLYEEYFNTEACKKVREKLVKALSKKIEDSYLKSDKENKYDKPSWSEYQADAIGARRTMKMLIDMLK